MQEDPAQIYSAHIKGFYYCRRETTGKVGDINFQPRSDTRAHMQHMETQTYTQIKCSLQEAVAFTTAAFWQNSLETD